MMTQSNEMTEADYRLLELLLSKLGTHIGNKICIIPGYIQDGYHIGVYKNGTGEPVTSASGATIKEVVEKLNQQPQTNGQNNGG